MSEWQFDPPAGITDRETGLHALAMQIRYDLTAAQGKLTELMRQIGELPADIPTLPTKCPYCGLERSGPLTMAEHIYNHHDGPVPAHYAAIEAASDEPSADFDASRIRFNPNP